MGACRKPTAEPTPALAGLTRPASFAATGESRTPRESIVNYNNFYEFSTSKEGVAKAAAGFATAGWQIEVDGLAHRLQTEVGQRGDQPLTLSFYAVDDYLTCPLRYKYGHVLRVPLAPHHSLIYGSALHAAVAEFHRRHARGDVMSEEQLFASFEAAWTNDGFLSREHEEARLAAGREALRTFRTAQLEPALQKAIQSIMAATFTFATPVVPTTSTTGSTKAYLAAFQSDPSRPFWKGYLKAYQRDSTGLIPVDANNIPLSSALVWEAGQVLSTTGSSTRTIKTVASVTNTVTGSTTVGTGSLSSFDKTNSAITQTLVAASSSTERHDCMSACTGFSSNQLR